MEVVVSDFFQRMDLESTKFVILSPALNSGCISNRYAKFNTQTTVMSKLEQLQHLKQAYDQAVGHIFQNADNHVSLGESEEIKDLIVNFRERVLSALSDLSEVAIGFVDEKYPNNTFTSAEKEEIAYKYASRINNVLSRGNAASLMSIPELLDWAIEYQVSLLDSQARIIDSIFTGREGEGHREYGSSVQNGAQVMKTAPKYEIFLEILNEECISFAGFDIAIEGSNKMNRPRKYPYRIVWLPEINCTVCVCDSIGDATFIYYGLVNDVDLHLASRGNNLKNIPCVSIHWSEKSYKHDLKEALLGAPPSIAESESRDVAMNCKQRVLSNKEGIAHAGITMLDGVCYFGDVKGSKYWKQWQYYPSMAFIREHVNDEGQITSMQDLKKMFQALGIIVATDEQEIQRWGGILLSDHDQIKEAGIVIENDVYYFGDAKGNGAWRKWRCFPNTGFNRDHRLGNKNGEMETISQLSGLFRFFGAQIATPEQERRRWGKILLSDQSLLDKAGIVIEDGVCYFWGAKGGNCWRQWKYYPNAAHNKLHRINESTGLISNIEQLKMMFGSLLGKERVATPEQEVERLGRILLSDGSLLETAGIVIEDNVCYFGDAKGSKFWKQWQTFPSMKYNQDHKIGDGAGLISNVEELRRMFRFVLGADMVATDEQERRRWGRILLSDQSLLDKAGIIIEDGVCYFGGAKGNKSWRQWRCFPNTAYNRKREIGNMHGDIENIEQLKKMFRSILGDNKVATEEQEEAREKRK